jgi:pimeloyl-ACP methyl ester carboxylesterase
MRDHRPGLSLALAAPLLLLAPPATAQDSVPRFEPSDCPFGTERELEGVDCGELVVWENRDRPEEGALRLAVAILRSSGEDPEPDPLVFLSGGPGNRSVFYAPSRASGTSSEGVSGFWNGIRENRDLVFYDQRGTGYSEPGFCDEMDRVLYRVRFLGLSSEEATARRVEAARSCREEMLAKGIDFSAYNSETSARDLDDLRRTLGYDRWNLFGGSYGARLALTAMRETPSGIRSVVLDAPDPPDARRWVDAPGKFARSLGLVFQQCAADEACRRAFPDLEARFHAWLDSLEARPLELTMEDTTRFADGRVVVDGDLAAAGVFRGLYDRRFIPVLPLLVREGGPEAEHVWRALVGRIARPPERNSRGLYLSVECHESAPLNPPAKIDSARARHPGLRVPPLVDHRHLHPVCDAWHQERADSTFFRPVRSDIPTLILGGEFDPVTPPEYGRLAAETLANSTFVEVPAHGHGVTPYTGCTRHLASRFLRDPAASLDTACVSEIPPVSFVTDVHRSRGVYPVARRLREGPDRTVLAAAGLLGLILLSGPLGWPAGALVRRLRGRPAPEATGLQRAARWLAGLAGLVALAFAAGLVLAIRDAASANPLILAFGVSGEFGWVFHLPWIVTALTAVVVLASARSWKEGWWSGGHRLHYGLVAAACVAFVAFVGSGGLMM